jgi:hypothetical protein
MVSVAWLIWCNLSFFWWQSNWINICLVFTRNSHLGSHLKFNPQYIRIYCGMLVLIGHHFLTLFWSLTRKSQSSTSEFLFLRVPPQNLLNTENTTIFPTMNGDPNTHPYLAPGRVSSIESWTRSIPRRSQESEQQQPSSPTSSTTNTIPTTTTSTKSIPSSTDETIQAYLRLKLAMLARNAGSWVLIQFWRIGARLSHHCATVFLGSGLHD